jgi:hypothetical protein
MDEVTRDWRKLHDEELHNLYSSISIIKMIQSRKTRLARHIARKELLKYAQNFDIKIRREVNIWKTYS